jgi:hypothetical protein
VRRYTQSLTVTGCVTDAHPQHSFFTVKTRSGDTFDAFVTAQTSFQVVQNLDGLNNDRVPNPNSFQQTAEKLIEKYIQPDEFIVAQGVYQVDDDKTRFDAKTVYRLASVKGSYLFEETHWWLTQTARLADQWLDSFFGDTRTYKIDDWVKLYSTNLNVQGLPMDDQVQECAVLSRLIYGLSAAYLILGDDRYRLAAAAAVQFQRDAFRSLSHDSQYCFWAFGRRKGKYGTQLMVPSESGVDAGSLALYEQIYALAGLANYYRISLDWEVLEDIKRTVRGFNDFYLDDLREGDEAFRGDGGYFSHIDYATMRPERNQNPNNNLKKNWNSVGDHIPAYLVNLLIALDPLPIGDRPELQKFQTTVRELLERVTVLILDKFPDKDPDIPYVNERFFTDWTPDHNYEWQQNRAIVGHNFKISWNLTRVANYYETLASQVGRAKGRPDPTTEAQARHYKQLAGRCMEMADRLGKAMTDVGIDQIRGGCFDAVERQPYAGYKSMPVEFTWGNTKDFWQQEQAILAYLIMFGHTQNPLYLAMARETEAFWNIFFLDREHRGMFFRVTDNGLPIMQGEFGGRGGHSDASGYHCFELNYLAHIYNRAYVSPANETDGSFCMYFRPDKNSRMRSINVLPDFMRPGSVAIEQVTVDGVPRRHHDPNYFQIELDEDDLDCNIAVQFRAQRRA